MPPRNLIPRRAGRLRLSALALLVICLPSRVLAQSGPAEGKEGLVELGKTDPRLKGHYAPKGFKVQIIAAEPAIIDPTGMAFDDKGNLYVSEWKSADHMLDTFDTLKLPEGGTATIQRRRKSTTDVVKRLSDRDGDGVYETAEVVVDGAEMPASIFPYKNSLYLTCVGRLERWSDEDGDGRFERRTIMADGFCGFYHHWLSGMTLNTDGWLYLTAGDNDNHVVGSDGSRVEISRCGGVFRGKLDGSKMNFFSMGFRNPYRDLAFNAAFDPFLVDNDQEEGSKFQGVRLINPVEGGDYGWRLRQGAPCCATDFDRGAVNGELPGKLPIVAKTGRGAPAGMIAYNGEALPETYRDVVFYPDVFRKLVRGYRVAPKGGSYELKEEFPLMTADDDLFRPCHAVVGPDGAIYVVDWRSNSGGAGKLWGDGKWGRIYKITWEGDGKTPALPLKENNWNRVIGASDDQLLAKLRLRDFSESDRAQKELVARGLSRTSEVEADKVRLPLLALMNDVKAPLHARLLGLQGARQMWDARVEMAMVKALDDASPEVRRLAAQAISWEPPTIRPDLVPTLIAHLKEADPRALRDVALALGRHGIDLPGDASQALLGWITTHPDSDAPTRDAFVRALERLGDPGVESLAKLIRTAKGATRSRAVAAFTAMRTKEAAARLPELATLDGLSDEERGAIVRQFKDIPVTIPVPTQGIAAWVVAHPEVGPAVKVAALDVCRLLGNPAPALVLQLLDDPSETVRLAATRLAAETRPEGMTAKLTARLGDASRSSVERIETARVLRIAGPAAFEGLKAAYEKFPDDPSFRVAALRAMADCDRGKVAAIARLATASEESAPVRAEAIAILGETPQTATELGREFLAGKLSRADLPAIRAAVRKYNAPEHVELAGKIEEAVAKGMAAISIPELKSRIEKGSDPWNGLQVYLREGGSRCYACHKIENFGGNVGPSLAGVSAALSTDKMIESILEPSKEIKEGYESYKVALKNGRVLGGIKVTQDATSLVLKDANGQETKIALADIDEQAKDPVSIMPVGLVYDLSPSDLADLIAFLRSKPAQDTLRNTQRLRNVLAVGPFAPGPDESHIPLSDVDPKKEFIGQDGNPARWLMLENSSGARVNLRGQFGLNPGRAYLAAFVRSEKAGDATLRLAIDGNSRVYLDGAKVGEVAASANVQPGVGPLVHLPLKQGWNTLVIAVDRPTQGEGQAALEINSADPVEVRVTRP